MARAVSGAGAGGVAVASIREKAARDGRTGIGRLLSRSRRPSYLIFDILPGGEPIAMAQPRPVLRRTAAAALTLLALSTPALAGSLKALVGGRLIDGYGGRPLDNSVVLIDGDRIQAVGRAGGRRGHLDGGDERAARAVGHARPSDDRRPRRLRPLGQDLSGPAPPDH